MKLLIVLFATIAVATAGTFQLRDAAARSTRSAAEQIVDLLEGLRDQMPCGFEKYNIPPLAPLKIEHKEVAVATESVSVDGEVNKVKIYGINQFEITEMKVNGILSKVNFNLLWEDITVKGLYDLETILKSYGLTVNVKGSGDMLLSIKDLNIKGTVKYSLGLLTGQIKLKEMKIVATVGDVDSNIEGLLGDGFVNRKMNEFIEEVVLLSVNDNQDFVTATIEEAVLPAVNSAVDGMSLKDVIVAFGGSSSEPTVCIPPEDV